MRVVSVSSNPAGHVDRPTHFASSMRSGKERTVTQSIERQPGLLRQNLRRQLRNFDSVDVDIRGCNQHSRSLAVGVVLERLCDFRSRVVALELAAEKPEQISLLDLDVAVFSVTNVDQRTLSWGVLVYE